MPIGQWAPPISVTQLTSSPQIPPGVWGNRYFDIFVFLGGRGTEAPEHDVWSIPLIGPTRASRICVHDSSQQMGTLNTTSGRGGGE